MLECRPALGTEDVAGTDAGATNRTALIIRHASRRGDRPWPSRLSLGDRIVGGGAPRGPYRLIVLCQRRIQGALPRTCDVGLARLAVAVVHHRGLPVARPWLRLGICRSDRERRGCLDSLSKAAGTGNWFPPGLVLAGIAVVCHPHRTLPGRHATHRRSIAVPWLASGS